jgi:ATP-binding cassette subfamily B protein
MCTRKNTKFFILFFIIDVIKPFRWLIVAQLLVAVIWAIDMSLRPTLIKAMLNKISKVLPSQAFDALLPQVIFYIFMSIIIVVIFRFYEWLLLRLHPNLKKHIGILLMSRAMNHSQNFYQNHFSGSIANQINDVTNAVPNFLDTLIDQLFSHFLALSIAIYTVWLIDLKFAIGLIIWIIIFLTISIKFSKKV